MASDPGQFAELQAQALANYPLSNPPPPMNVTPAGPASSPAVSPPKKEREEETEENDAATVTVPKDVLDRVRANPKALLEDSKPKAPTPAAGRPYNDLDDSAEPTKAVPRDQLLGKDGHVVIGADAGGEDATLAVPPGANEASGINLGAAIGESLQGPGPMGGPMGPEGGFPPPPGGHPYQSQQGMMNPHGGPGPHGMHGMGMGMPSSGGGPGMTMGMPGQHPGMDQWGGQHGAPGAMQGQPWSSGHMPVANPRAQGGVPSYGGGPMMQQQGGIPRQQAPTNWNPLQPPAAKSKISGQMILLFVVGFVCLAIFVTGIVLFATTKF